jgi:glycerol-3-phosphate dehydrogenase
VNRQQILDSIKQKTTFDLLVIGGGASGCGIAVDAASRGLRVALIEKNDFAEGTSSRSTKLVHGGVRYLEKAVKHLDRCQYNLVKEGLHERGAFLKNAPHLANRLAFVTPIYKWIDVPYIFSGLVLYDLLAGLRGIGRSRLIGRKEALSRFPMLKSKGLKAGVVYYDGQFNDARMAVTLALTAQKYGAVVANHVEAVSLEKVNGKLCGARVLDTLSGDEFTIHARGVINATGPFADRLRQMDEPSATPILNASSGIHIVLSSRFVPPETGLMIPETEDGRVLFILPWQGQALIGTTENPAEIVEHPRAKEEEIEYLLRHLTHYFDIAVTRSDVKSVWSGLRPLILAQDTTNTAELVREHLIKLSPSGLLTIAGGKWTSYRKMAEETVDQAVLAYNLEPACSCHTGRLPLVGAEDFDRQGDKLLIRRYGFDNDVAHHFHHAYGDQANRVAELARLGLGARLHSDHPFLEAEVVYAARHEFAECASDVLTRRLPLALIDNAAAKAALPRVVELMANELGWDQKRRNEEMEMSMQRLNVAI